MEMSETCHQGVTKLGFELVESRSIDQTSNNFSNVKGFLEVFPDNAIKIVR